MSKLHPLLSVRGGRYLGLIKHFPKKLHSDKIARSLSTGRVIFANADTEKNVVRSKYTFKESEQPYFDCLWSKVDNHAEREALVSERE